jgi:long-chain acyl-CoA synthetase
MIHHRLFERNDLMFDFSTKKSTGCRTDRVVISKLSDIVNKYMPLYGEKVAIRYDNGDYYDSLTYAEYLPYIGAFIEFLKSEQAEQKVIATLCKNRIEWDMIALSSFFTANIIFPIDTKTNDVELAHLLSIAPPDYIVLSRAQLEKFRDIKINQGLTTKVIVADLKDVFEDIGFETVIAAAGELKISNIIQSHKPAPNCQSSALLDHPDTILGYYGTSGTTQLPKVVRITNNNILAELKEGMDVINFRPNEDGLNIGPYTHIATLVEFLVSKAKGFSITYFTREPDEDGVLENEITKLKKQNVRLRALMAVPKFWIFLLKDLLEEIKNKSYFHSIYQHLIKVEKNDKMVNIGTLDRAKLMAIKTLLRNKLGGYFSYGISSSMKLDGSMVEIFGKLGITIIDIYGATECTGIISRNRLNDLKPGSCGKVISVFEWKLTDKRQVPGLRQEIGILNLKGPTIAHSYVTEKGVTQHLNATSKGYFSTGDLCWFDEEGWLHLVGREKELIKWDDGSLIDPQHLSNLLVKSIFVKDALVTRVKPDDVKLTVYLFPDYKKIENDPNWRAEINTGIDQDTALKSRMEDAIKYAQSISSMSAAMDTEDIYILSQKLERTPTHKIKFIFELKRLHLARKI